MKAIEVMKILYPGLPEWQLQANAEWLDDMAEKVKDGGFIASPADAWVVQKVREGEYELVSTMGQAPPYH